MLEAWLIWVYRNFDVPPVGGGRPTLRAATLPVEADSLQKARRAVTLEKAPKSKLGLLNRILKDRAKEVARSTRSTAQAAMHT